MDNNDKIHHYHSLKNLSPPDCLIVQLIHYNHPTVQLFYSEYLVVAVVVKRKTKKKQNEMKTKNYSFWNSTGVSRIKKVKPQVFA